MLKTLFLQLLRASVQQTRCCNWCCRDTCKALKRKHPACWIKNYKACLTECAGLTRETCVRAAPALAQSDNALCIRSTQSVSACDWVLLRITYQQNFNTQSITTQMQHSRSLQPNYGPDTTDYHNRCAQFGENQTPHTDASSLKFSWCNSPLSQVCGKNLFSTQAIIICIDWLVCIDRTGMWN